MSSTTIRYSGVPENSHSRGIGPDSAVYATAPGHPQPGPLPDSDQELSALLRARLRVLSARDADQRPGTDAASTDPVSLPVVTGGRAGPVSEDPRHNPAYPHPKNPGLFSEVDGFYDWADRRLFLSDGSPDPMTPGAYRYQTRPDLCLLDAADDDPWSPRYEPDHLRHKPGDDWLIDKHRPYDVLDPGPFGTPGWFPDRRTGRHRRDELPDPIPWWEIEEDPEKAAWAEHAEALYDRRTRLTREREARETQARQHETHESPAAEAREGEAPPVEAREAPVREHNAGAAGHHSGRSGGDRHFGHHGDGDSCCTSDSGDDSDHNSDSRDHEDRSGPPTPPMTRSSLPRVVPDQPSRQPNQQTQPQSGPPSRPRPRPQPGRQTWQEADRQERPHGGDSVDPIAGHRFSKLREDAWDRFLDKSFDLAAAHQRQPSALERECGPVLRPWVRMAKWLFDTVKRTRKDRSKAAAEPRRAVVPAARRVPLQPRAHSGPCAPFAAAAAGVQLGTGRNDRMSPAVRSARLAAALGGARRARAELAASRSAAESGLSARVDAFAGGGAVWA